MEERDSGADDPLCSRAIATGTWCSLEKAQGRGCLTHFTDGEIRFYQSQRTHKTCRYQVNRIESKVCFPTTASGCICEERA